VRQLQTWQVAAWGGLKQRTQFRVCVGAHGTGGTLIDSGRLRPHVAAVFSLDRVRDAHRALEYDHPRGKIVLHMA
jgi:NADPH:quinone reductase-like Zn-dependent oxidoreductase